MLDRVAADLHVSAGATAWVVVAFNLALASTSALLGGLVDVQGARRSLCAGAVLLAAGSAVAATAGGLPALGAGRALQGLGVAAAAAAAFASIGAVADDAARRRRIGLLTAGTSCAFGAGPVIGAAAAQVGGWRTTMLVPLVPTLIMLAAIAVAPRGRPDEARSTSVDARGATLLFVIAAALLTALQAPTTGLGVAPVAALAAVALAASIALSRQVRARPGAFVAVGYLRRPQVARAVVLGSGLAGSQIGFAFVAPLVLLDAQPGRDLLDVGVVLLPGTVLPVALALALAGPLGERVPLEQLLLGLITLLAATFTLTALALGDVTVALATGLSTAGFAGTQVSAFSVLPRLTDLADAGLVLGLAAQAMLISGAAGAALAAVLFNLLTPAATVALLAVPGLLGAFAALMIGRDPTWSHHEPLGESP